MAILEWLPFHSIDEIHFGIIRRSYSYKSDSKYRPYKIWLMLKIHRLLFLPHFSRIVSGMSRHVGFSFTILSAVKTYVIKKRNSRKHRRGYKYSADILFRYLNLWYYLTLSNLRLFQTTVEELIRESHVFSLFKDIYQL